MMKAVAPEISHKIKVQECLVKDLGLIDHSQAYVFQRQCVQTVLEGEAPGFLLLCEHPAIITLGRMSHHENFLLSPQQIQQQGVQISAIDRGGDMTLHAPGQLVVYSILNLNHFKRDLKFYLELLQQTTVDLLEDFGITAQGISEKRGVWVGADKIASIGIGVRKWVSFHGASINVSTDLKLFSMIRPCGLDVKMTSVEKTTQQKHSMAQVKEKFVIHFEENFQLKMIKE